MEEGLKEGRWRTVPQMHADLSRDFGITKKRMLRIFWS